jgi:hypothetical protein
MDQHGGVAQAVEHLPFKQVVGSSSLPTLTKLFEGQRVSDLLTFYFAFKIPKKFLALNATKS